MTSAVTAPPAAPPPPRRSRVRGFLLTLVLIAIAYGVGYVPQWIELRRLREEQQRTALDLRLADLHRTLGLVTLEVQRNNFGSASEQARRFFDDCVATVPLVSAEPRTSAALASYAAQRDEIMGMLATANPAVRERLAGLYLAMNGVLDRRE